MQYVRNKALNAAADSLCPVLLFDRIHLVIPNVYCYFNNVSPMWVGCSSYSPPHILQTETYAIRDSTVTIYRYIVYLKIFGCVEQHVFVWGPTLYHGINEEDKMNFLNRDNTYSNHTKHIYLVCWYQSYCYTLVCICVNVMCMYSYLAV